MEETKPDRALRRRAPGPASVAVAVALTYIAAGLLHTNGTLLSTRACERTRRRSVGDEREEMALWRTVGILGSALALGLAWLASMGFGVHGVDLDRDLLFRLCLSVLVPVPGLFLYREAWEKLRARFWTTWWDPSTTCADGPIGWEDVLRMTAGAEAGDALTSQEHLRRQRLRRMVLPYALCLSAMLFAGAMMVNALLIWRLPSFFGTFSGSPSTLLAATANISGNLTAYLGLLAAAISIIFTYRQLRAKVRADNRQAWIDRARRLLSELAQTTEAPTISRHADRLDRSRIELELMLNPSEKDHRLLIYLLQRLRLQSRADDVAGAKALLRVMRADVESGSSLDAVTWLETVESADPELLVGYVVRLSHVVLKREWERVKHTR